jgi:hypothetical protein
LNSLTFAKEDGVDDTLLGRAFHKRKYLSCWETEEPTKLVSAEAGLKPVLI